jgi:Tfp pilus assembly protein PilN
VSIINLLPEDYLQRRAHHRANIMCVVLFAIVMAGVCGAAMVSEQNTQNTEMVRNQVDSAYEQAARTLQQMQQLENQKRMMLAKAQATGDLLERVPRSFVLAVVTRALPEGASLVSFNMTPRRVLQAPVAPAGARPTKFAAVTGANAAPRQLMVIEVTGLAANDVQVARFIANLLGNPLLSGVDLGFSREKVIEKTVLREFSVRMELRPGVDVIDLIEAQGGKVARLDGEAVSPETPVAAKAGGES